ncbi:MAG: restriction endonuclease subunit S [Verrucomicrobia bacterium]|nr:MAG: restriction endonuclease subunit S [Verrucomicrobiota bacterium]
MTLRDAGVSLIDCEHRTPPAAVEGFPYIAIPQLKEGRIDLSDVRRISRRHLDEWTRRAKPQVNDVILSRRCNPGETAWVPPGLECALGQNLVLLRSAGSQVFPPFLRWLVRSPAWWEQVARFINVGAVFDSLKCADIPNFELPLPPVPQQRAIASILGALDDKIELNRRMNETLEGIAQVLFKSWFVDAIENGLPEGWRESTIGEEVCVMGGSTPSTSRAEFWEGGAHHWATPKDLAPLTSPVLLSTERRITDAGIQQISSGLLPVGTVLLSSRAPIGYLSIAEVPVAVNQGFIAMVCNKDLPNHFVRLWTSHNMELIRSNANGTTFMEISKSNFRPLPVAVPPKPLLDGFSDQMQPLHQRIVSNVKESQQLATIRDTLLPKLLSGELRVPIKNGSQAPGDSIG